MPKAAASLSNMAQNAIVQQIKDLIDDTERNATFAIGGNVKIDLETGAAEGTTPARETGASEASGKKETVCSPVQIRFNCNRKLVLPTSEDSAQLGQLIAACQAASFGRGSEDVDDESYRKASKLDTSDFLTDFCPYKLGIIDTIAQDLVPVEPTRRNLQYGVRAELHKLNVYSAPDGRFKPHVDTPGGEKQFGSLVVRLPVPHSGGALAVRHNGKEISFDFSTSAGESEGTSEAEIKWAAFYSDCEHEVIPVTRGHRLTLTYNLFSTTRVSGSLAGRSIVPFNVTQIPLFHTLRDALQSPSFFHGVRILAMQLSHSCAHTSSASGLPWSLK